MSQDLIRLLNDTGRSWSIARTVGRRGRPLFFVDIFAADTKLIAHEIGHDLADCVVRAIMAAHAPAAAPTTQETVP